MAKSKPLALKVVALKIEPAVAKPKAVHGVLGPKRTRLKPKLGRNEAKAAGAASVDRLQRLWTAIDDVRAGRRDSPRTAKLLAAGPAKMAQKVVEEAAEVAIEAVTGGRATLVNESVDVIYNLTVLWNTLGVDLEMIWAEMDRREGLLGMAEKLPKTDDI